MQTLQDSYFDGKLLEKIGYRLLGILITVFTLGICYPWALCMMQDWKVRHIVINGKRLSFNGTAIQLFGNWIKWLLLCVITLGIYSFFMAVEIQKWTIKHTYFE